MRDSIADSPGRRAAAYWFEDGFPDIVFGVSLGLSALAALLWYAYVPAGARKAYFAVVAVGFLLYFWKERGILEILKSRFTYPRTGYAQPPEEMEEGRRNALTTLSLGPERPGSQNVTLFRQRTVMTVFWFCYLIWNPQGRWQVPVMMLALAIALYVMNRKSEHPYAWWSVLILALLGALFLLTSIPVPFAPLLALLLTGAWLTAQGVAALAGYLHANPRASRSLRA